MIAILGMLGSTWPYLLAGAGVLWGVFKHLQSNSKDAAADKKVAQAQTAVAQAQTAVAQAQTTLAQANDASAQANATAAQAGAESLKEKVNVTNDVTSMPAGAAAAELRSDWSK